MDKYSELSRRRFVKLLTFGTATSMVAGKLWRRDLLAYCENAAGQKDTVLKIKISDYPAIQQAFGSVRLGINPILGDVNLDGDFYPFMINRDGFDNFHVLDCQCRHAGCIVPPYNNMEFIIRCVCHGSEYDIDGTVLRGPALESLHTYPCEFDGDDTLTIHIPCWGFDVKLALQSGGPNARLRLDFPTFRNVTYEVTFKQKPQDPWSVASFALSPTGPCDQTSLIGDGLPATAYLDRPASTGLFAVGMKLVEM